MTTAHVTPDPRLESRTRRRFSAAEKIALIDQFDALPHGDKGSWLRQNGLYAAQLSIWRKERREHGEAALEPKPPGQKPKDPREVRIEQLTRELAKLRKRAELAEALVELQKKSCPWTRPTRATRPRRGADRRTTALRSAEPRLRCAGRLAGRALSGPSEAAQTGGLRRDLSAAEREQLLALMHEPRFCDQAPRQIHATLMSEGRVLASVSTLYRILRAAGETPERRAQRPPQRHAVPRLSAERPNQVWTWDITRLPTPESGVFLFLYLILDLYSRYVVGWMVSTKENGGLARHLLQETLAAHGVEPQTLTVHQDRGAPMVAETYRDFLDATGVDLSYSRPRVSNDNAFSEAHFKTLKYRPDYPGRFASADEARAWIGEFIRAYHERPHQGLALYSPADVYRGRVDAVQAIRQKALDAHYTAHPERYSKPPTAHRPPPQGHDQPAGCRAAVGGDAAGQAGRIEGGD